MSPINTKKVADHRRLRFDSIDDVLAEVDRIVAADDAGTLRRTGNWTAGQAFNHLACWIDYGYEGFPGRRPPWFVRAILRMKKKKYMRDGAPRGIRIPGVAGGTHGCEPMSTHEGAARLRRSLQRLKDREPARFDSPAFGPMSHDDRVKFQLRHAELHLGFLHP